MGFVVVGCDEDWMLVVSKTVIASVVVAAGLVGGVVATGPSLDGS